MLEQDFQELIENADYTTRAYSGRGMYGRECLGVVLDRGQSVFDFIADVLDFAGPDQDAMADYIRDINHDNLGLDTIVYFPSVSYKE